MRTVIILLSVLCTLFPALAQNFEQRLDTNRVLYPGQVYTYGPYGLTHEGHAAQFFDVLLCVDSVNGFAAGCSLKVENLYGTFADTLHYLPTPRQIVFAERIGAVPSDTCYHFDAQVRGASEHFYRLTVTDTIKVVKLREWSGR